MEDDIEFIEGPLEEDGTDKLEIELFSNLVSAFENLVS